jgi:hypothetical protein
LNDYLISRAKRRVLGTVGFVEGQFGEEKRIRAAGWREFDADERTVTGCHDTLYMKIEVVGR